MPAFAICSDEMLWARFKGAVFSYQKERVLIAMATPSELPYVSGTCPFRFDKDGHHRFLAHVSAYRRSHVKVTQDTLCKIQALGLLTPSAIIGSNGCATGKFEKFFVPIHSLLLLTVPSNFTMLSVKAHTKVREGCKRVRLPNFLVALPSGSKSINAYTPFTAQPNSSWRTLNVSIFKFFTWGRSIFH